MKKLWKDNGGYALAYVLIVVLVLCAVAVSVCTAALKNYQAQERSIRQTQQLYQAEGEIERFVALAEDVHLLEFPAEHYTTVCIKTEIRMELAYVYDEETTTQPLPDGTTTTVIKYAAKVSKATHHYNTYTITHLTAEGGTSE